MLGKGSKPSKTCSQEVTGLCVLCGISTVLTEKKLYILVLSVQ